MAIKKSPIDEIMYFFFLSETNMVEETEFTRQCNDTLELKYGHNEFQFFDNWMPILKSFSDMNVK